jgi:hypothetical protein
MIGRSSLSNETLHFGGQLSVGRENFDRTGTAELYVASPSKGDGASTLVGDRARFPDGRECACLLLALPASMRFG